MMRKDLEAAGIPCRDASDRVADFHALRHTFITRLARSGVAPAVAKSLSRHSGPTLTMDHPGWAPLAGRRGDRVATARAHTFIEDDRSALARLPEPGAKPHRKEAARPLETKHSVAAG